MTSTTQQPDPTPTLSRVATYILLAIGPEERHGYAIMHEVHRITDGAVTLGPGAIYTTIKRLLADGLIVRDESRLDAGAILDVIKGLE